MTDFGTMTNRVLRDLTRTKPNDLTAHAQDEIKTSIAHYEKRRFWFVEGRATASTTSGTEYYALPTDFLDEDIISIQVNNWTYPLIKRTWGTIEDWFVQSNTFLGYPTDFALYQEQIRLYPIPNGTYTLTISYYKQLDSLSADGDTNAWMVEGEELIRTHTEERIYRLKIKDRVQADEAKTARNEVLAEMMKLTNARLLTGRTRRRRM